VDATKSPDDFADLFSLDPSGAGRFVAAPPGEGFLFGGLTMALVLRAASATVRPELRPRSLHTTFLNGGLWGPPIDLAVDNSADSRAFSTRTVAAEQAGRHLVDATVSFHRPEGGQDWQPPAPEVPPPESLPSRPVEFGSGANPVELRPVFESAPGFVEIIHPFWARTGRPAGVDDPGMLFSALVFLTDYLVISTPFPRGTRGGEGKLVRTLEHSVWFHRPILDDDWLLYSSTAASIADGRYFSSGTVHDRPGRLLATFAQQGMIRAEDPPR
jgi:acyl-CoA thioesterase-2